MRKGAIKKVAKYVSRIEDIVADLNDILSDEQIYYEERSEEWQESDRGEEFQDVICAVEEFRDALENATYEMEEIINQV